MRGTDSSSRTLTKYLDHRSLKPSPNIVGLDNDALNSCSMLVAPLISKRGEEMGTIIMELCTKDVVNVTRDM
jgi:hypothetical protein